MRFGPLVFAEILKPKPWGGRSLARVCGKSLPPGEQIGESWEVADHPHGVSVVSEGPLGGATLSDLVAGESNSLLGSGRSTGRFPLLVKLVHAKEQLSVQVHPDDGCARAMKLTDSGKTEAWYVVQVSPGGRIIAGLKSRRDVPRLPELALSGEIVRRLRTIHPRRGEALLCPAGAVHALGPGVVLLEIQQNSDATFRLYDWGRVGLDGKPRELHLNEAVRAVGDRPMRLVKSRPRTLRSMPFPAQRLVSCDKFVMDLWRVPKASDRSKEGQFEILHVVAGSGMLRSSHWPDVRLRKGRTVLVPASVHSYKLFPRLQMEIVRTAQ